MPRKKKTKELMPEDLALLRPSASKLPMFVEGILVPETYDPERHYLVDVTQLERDTPDKNRRAIQAWLQGMVEGTIHESQERRKSLELSARLDGLLISRSMKIEARGTLKPETLDAILNFASNRHTLVFSSAETLAEARRSSLSPPSAEKGNKNG
jgi:hypothetical protein